MGIAEIRAKSNQFVANLDVFIADAIEEVNQSLTDLNREQMLDSLRSDDRAITPEYSPKYAKRKGFEFPNLYDKGDFQSDMFLVNDGREFFITSADSKNPMLIEKYSDKIFGIPKSKQSIAQNISLSSLARIYNKFVLNG